MDPHWDNWSFCCVLCGAPIGYPDNQWMQEMRAVYSDEKTWLHPALSGVGFWREENRFIPADPASRYDDPGIADTSMPLVVQIVAFHWEERPGPYWGFGFHASCWSVLCALYQPKKVDIQPLIDICRSFPHQDNLPNWGHDFGGLMRYIAEPSHLFPGDEPVFWGRNGVDRGFDESLFNFVCSADPLDLPGIKQVLQGTSNQEEAPKGSEAKVVNIAPDSQDCFARIPMEILQLITLLLPSRDVLQLKLSSPTFARLLLPGSFWASRFQPGFEFHCVFEARQPLARQLGWKELYLAVQNIQSTSNYLNRRRVWDIALQLAQICDAITPTSMEGNVSRSFYEPEGTEDDVPWEYAGGWVNERWEPFERGCVALWTRTAVLPSKIIGMHVSFITYANAQYVSGIRFQQPNGQDICLGRIFKNETSFNIMALAPHEHGNCISGFHLAVDSKGIRAISVQTEVGQTSQWLGDPSKTPKMRLIAQSSHIIALKGSFDAIKLVSLGISEASTDTNGCVSLARNRSVRDTVRWYPDIPDETLSINNAAQLDLPRRTLFVTMLYGGLRGVRLPHLIGITAWTFGTLGIYRIDFIYDTQIDGQKTHTVGGRGPFSHFRNGRGRNSDSFANSEISFQIDGPGGEMITAVDSADLDGVYRGIRGFRIQTNYGRMAMFSPALGVVGEYSLAIRPLPVAERTTITGIYASFVRNTSDILADEWKLTPMCCYSQAVAA
ncbi:uncharacterized protein BP5553_06266 [Venustampulla echinocandica]|uniref:DUF7600 domain-containing protein n=1 Tax=Venustampulla echinocandica TaxID=2656787 RepID=A0A370TN20_9HELO|nr:uncharacterized protein BP5553_06266 [Venustampulla echinocandica]RDL36914.1 hypothetical protein BP5553_06266 [Venustampulla echinocandica]